MKEIEAVPRKKDRQRIVKRIEQLGDNPRPVGCQKLSSQNRYRVRQGQYRIVYGVEDDRLIVYVVKVGHHKDVYRAPNKAPQRTANPVCSLRSLVVMFQNDKRCME